MRILLVEPDYKSKFPPLGLLKIGTFHKNRGDEVSFVRGLTEPQYWDRIYITTLFSFHHAKMALFPNGLVCRQSESRKVI